VRVFAALPLPAAGLRWVSAGGFHMTLHFFGEVTDAGVAALLQVCDDPELRAPAIPMRLGKIGQFPPRGNPRVLWVGLEHGEAEARAYWSLFEKKISPLGWSPDERGFSAHITVARAGRSAITGWDAVVEIPGTDFLMEECVLFQSILGQAGAQYVPLKKISLVRGHG
jgi:2'-5' RNA ligase